MGFFSHYRRGVPDTKAVLRGLLAVLLGAGLVVSLSGCVLTAIVTHEIVTGLGVASLLTTGKGLTDHALDAVTGQDCRMVSGLLKEDRKVCEPRGSVATSEDFKGVLGYSPVEKTPADPDIQWSQESLQKQPFSGYLSLSEQPPLKAKSALAGTSYKSFTGRSTSRMQSSRVPGSSYRRLPGPTYSTYNSLSSDETDDWH